MTKLSVNINKIATIRNARGGDVPNVLQVALDCEAFGADGITVHPRPDERHIRRSDVFDLKKVLRTELNVEGNPTADFMKLVTTVRPAQVTLVPDSPDALTSSAGWNTLDNGTFLTDIVDELHAVGIRASIFVDPDLRMIEAAAKIGADRVELYTEPYATFYPTNRESAVAAFVESAKLTKKIGLGLNAGHDLSLVNLHFLYQQIPWLDEVSIGHALISDALYLGLEKTIKSYKDCLKNTDI